MHLKQIYTFALLILCQFVFAVNLNVAALIKKGFPEDYAKKLAILQKKYPLWEFEPLHITVLDPRYTWDYVLMQETDASPSRSLISGKKIFSSYFHPFDKKIYDVGCRRASTDAVAYFLDPRNFLNERDIFQFENLQAPKNISMSRIENALDETFMENEKLENGYTYAQYFCYLGKKFNIDPLFLAARARQEQGLKRSPMVNGECGSFLAEEYKKKFKNKEKHTVTVNNKKYTCKDLLDFDGLYNYFNINAGGGNRLEICLNGMIEAQNGSPSMAEQWGSPKWDRRWKSLYGGALKISLNYVVNYQNTSYLQKWNVDARCKNEKGQSRNFWGQYMQNIGAPFSEASTVYYALKKQNMLNMPFRFLIPVYKNMPYYPSPDPANGKCVYYRAYDYEKNIGSNLYLKIFNYFF